MRKRPQQMSRIALVVEDHHRAGAEWQPASPRTSSSSILCGGKSAGAAGKIACNAACHPPARSRQMAQRKDFFN
jgi:hypothetical protein